jgi:hypothetical protein
MTTKAGNCVLIIEGQRFQGISCAVEWNDQPQAFGFLRGPIDTLRKARSARRIQLELDDGAKLVATIMEVNQAGMALVAFDPTQLPRSGRT